jgi:hypothetical protein
MQVSAYTVFRFREIALCSRYKSAVNCSPNAPINANSSFNIFTLSF